MAYNLARNSRVFVTTNVNTATGAVTTTGLTTLNTWELQVLDGFKFTQNTATSDIGINEAGNTPIRGKQAFNTALNPVDISFSTYVRPYSNAGASAVTCEERVLWNALLGYVGIEGTTQAGSVVTALTLGGTPSTLSRASTDSPRVTFNGATLNTSFVQNEIYNVSGMTGAAAGTVNTPVKVVSTSATALVVDYLTAPNGAGTATITGVTASASVKFTKSAWQENAAGAGTYAFCSSAMSNKNQLQPIGFIFVVDNAAYTIDNCAIDQAQLDFGLDAIAMVNWTAKGTKLNQLTAAPTISNASDPVLSGSITGTAKGKNVNAGYITNKLSTTTLVSNIDGIAGTAYSVVITGGSLTIANNINYVTPANIGVVNVPIGYFTGNRAVSGSLNAYLKTGASGTPWDTSTLLKDLLASTNATSTKFNLQIEVGGASNPTKVEFDMIGCMIGIPTVDIADVVSTTISFNAQGTNANTTNNLYDIENTNDLTIRYYSAV